MSETPQEIREVLMSSDSEFRRLAEEHSHYEAQLEDLHRQSYLSSDDLLLEVKLKKMKLRLKDRMEELVARHRQGIAPR